MKAIDTIIWDWNGTLLDDTDLCIHSINPLLKDRGLPELSKEHYLEVFGFPVIDYYRNIGFNLEQEPFEVPAMQFIENYSKGVEACSLHQGAIEVLKFFKEKSKRQIVLSAMEHEKLEASIQQFHIGSYFETVSGLDHDYAHSKIEIGKKLLVEFQINPQHTCLIGDTLHDLEVARELGCFPVLVARGHQSYSRLKKQYNLVFESLFVLADYFSF